MCSYLDETYVVSSTRGFIISNMIVAISNFFKIWKKKKDWCVIMWSFDGTHNFKVPWERAFIIHPSIWSTSASFLGTIHVGLCKGHRFRQKPQIVERRKLQSCWWRPRFWRSSKGQRSHNHTWHLSLGPCHKRAKGGDHVHVRVLNSHPNVVPLTWSAGLYVKPTNLGSGHDAIFSKPWNIIYLLICKKIM